jgi:hypothetical protein
LPRSTNLPWRLLLSTLLIALIWKMLEKKSAVQTDRHMLVAQTDASIFPERTWYD